VRDAGGGDDRLNSFGLFRPKDDDQGDLARFAFGAESGPEGYPIGDDGVSLRTRGATPAEEFAFVRLA